MDELFLLNDIECVPHELSKTMIYAGLPANDWQDSEPVCCKIQKNNCRYFLALPENRKIQKGSLTGLGILSRHVSDE